jgi:hypothetical protein
MSDKKGTNCKTYECEKCNFVTAYSNSYKRHTKSSKHTGIIVKRTRAPNKIKREIIKKERTMFKCSECEFTSNLNTNLTNHYLKNHADEKERKEKFKYYYDECCFGTFSVSDNAIHINSKYHKRRDAHYQSQQNNA